MTSSSSFKPWRVVITDAGVDTPTDHRTSQAADDHVIAVREAIAAGRSGATGIRIYVWSDGDWALYERAYSAQG
ncbi:hypothetical protein P3T37_005077 [Kitasatospora sp. MAA4]|uniref:hypothetical protein n=1 Tax=Kitasatospora sp. MAA4 TaxID=3035093 RepID=UPI0024762A42|nr:hypothetical protein [Kitasatospora sp. MAA4]MDH6135660.1 hypothetical protein [Kitasatospora sp. MAA4]